MGTWQEPVKNMIGILWRTPDPESVAQVQKRSSASSPVSGPPDPKLVARYSLDSQTVHSQTVDS